MGSHAPARRPSCLVCTRGRVYYRVIRLNRYPIYDSEDRFISNIQCRSVPISILTWSGCTNTAQIKPYRICLLGATGRKGRGILRILLMENYRDWALHVYVRLRAKHLSVF
ncbi:hypothetical protein BDV40DRAFT_262347 [Aspergillus tamarii]|uniref:Uncharacterized protein n=1 Tax=Aspergillus tamarii TaxID=41984 RepID=A0A5N6UYB3_ASPTM|nr:hypothetical protein BDV40DRAFT_262347 [Aspergillus tamarii]